MPNARANSPLNLTAEPVIAIARAQRRWKRQGQSAEADAASRSVIAEESGARTHRAVSVCEAKLTTRAKADELFTGERFLL